MAFPNNNMTNTVNMGTLTEVGNETGSSSNIAQNAASFNVSQSALVSMSKIDDIMKFIKNDYINRGSGGSDYTYLMALTFNWVDGNSTNMSNGYTTLKDITNCYEGFEVKILTDDPDFVKDKTTNGTVLLSIVPPAKVIRHPGSFKTLIGASTRLTNDKSTPLTTAVFGHHGDYSDDYIFAAYANPNHYLKLVNSLFAAGGFLNTGNGTWVIKKGTTEIAWFDLAITLPYQDGIFNVVVPSVKCNVDSAGKITGFNVKWLRYNKETKAFDEVDYQSLKSLIPKYYYYVSGMGKSYAQQNEYMTDDGNGNLSMTNTYYFTTYTQVSNTVGKFALASIQCSYDVSGQRISYTYKGPARWNLGMP